jgi:hypothetical protein
LQRVSLHAVFLVFVIFVLEWEYNLLLVQAISITAHAPMESDIDYITIQKQNFNDPYYWFKQYGLLKSSQRVTHSNQPNTGQAAVFKITILRKAFSVQAQCN